MNRDSFRSIGFQTVGLFALTQLAHLVKINIVIGTYAAFFSLNNSIMPLSGALLGFSGATVLAALKMGLSVLLLGGVFSLHHLAFHIPSLFGAYYWASSSYMIRAVVPMGCILLFVLHPVGNQAWLYSMYWFIPVVLFVTQGNNNNLFLQALGSTFVAHAVGSVIWLYTTPMTSATWLSLIPIVFIERLLFALGMVALYGVHKKVSERIRKINLSIGWIA